jgi:hypothetical protein
MSTKTTFKRVALVAVAALGLGVLSVVPSSAAVTNVSVTQTTAGTAGQVGARTDSTTGAQISFSALYDAGTSDTATIQFVQAAPYPVASSGTTTVVPVLQYLETSTTVSTVKAALTTAGGSWTNAYQATDSVTASSTYTITPASNTSGYIGVKFALFLDSNASTTRTAGTYSYTVITKSYNSGILASTINTPVTITIDALASASTTASAAYSTLGDPSVSTAVATVSTTAAAKATLALVLKNASDNTAAKESVTATITGPGTIGDGTVNGKSVVLKYSSTSLTLNVYSDGTAGVSTINVSTPSVTFAPKTITFYAKSPKTITAAVYNPVLNVGANTTAVAATAVDANGTNWAGSLYIKAVAAADALIGGSATAPVACEYNSTEKTHFCPITTLTAGTAKFVVVDQSLALGTETAYAAAMSAATSNEVSVTASAGVPTTVKLAFDKATYQPFEKALITVTPLDAAGKTLGTRTITNLFAAGGITSNIAFGSASDTLTAVSRTTAAANGTDTTAGAYTYVVYMPAQGDVTISATGGTGLAAAGQVKVTATASVVNDSVNAATDAANEATDAANAATDAALAAADAADAATAAAQDASDAVAALSASVSKLISSLRAQITSLTNLVIKIQKKVKA